MKTNVKIDDNTNKMVCPYCGYEERNPGEWDEQWSSSDCGSCGEEYMCERIVIVQYSTWKKDQHE